MSNATTNEAGMSLNPLGAGDLIDRAVRFYRRNFWTFVMIASPPVIVGTLFSVGWTLLGRQIFSFGTSPSAERTFYYLFAGFGSIVIWLVESVATIVVMGGASRSFVRHLLFGEAITFKETYRSTLKRLGGLVVSSTMITVLLATLGFVFFYFGAIVITLAVFLLVWAFSFLPVVAAILSVIVGIAVCYLTLWLFFLVASRFAYVPQAMLVEGLGAFAAIGRSAGLASGSSRRLMALFLFTLVATYSALAILYVPLAWYAWANGIELMSFTEGLAPAWLEISKSLIGQVSFILLSPVWTIGLCLLYVDERVRSEGYDIELMAARRLGDIPDVPVTYINPLQPAIGSTVRPVANVPPASSRGKSVLGLDQ